MVDTQRNTESFTITGNGKTIHKVLIMKWLRHTSGEKRQMGAKRGVVKITTRII